MNKERWFTVATEGQTTDGRNILAQWLLEIAETYDPKKYGARIWMEHIRSATADSPFRAYGDVLAVRTGENAEGKVELQAQLDPTPDLVAMTKNRQKLYTSIEIQPNFANAGKCGLVGLAVTDSPASLGTTMLQFAAKHPDANPLKDRKQSPDNLFSCVMETALNFDDATAEDPTTTALQTIAATFRRLLPGAGAAPSAVAPTPTIPAAFSHAEVVAVTQALSGIETALKQSSDRHAAALEHVKADLAEFKKAAASAKDLEELRAVLDKTPGAFTARPPAAGGNGRIATDC